MSKASRFAPQTMRLRHKPWRRWKMAGIKRKRWKKNEGAKRSWCYRYYSAVADRVLYRLVDRRQIDRQGCGLLPHLFFLCIYILIIYIIYIISAKATRSRKWVKMGVPQRWDWGFFGEKGESGDNVNNGNNGRVFLSCNYPFWLPLTYHFLGTKTQNFPYFRLKIKGSFFVFFWK